MRFDLQSHSTASDGTLPPAEVVARAASAGVELLALTDHDTVAGVPEARAAARRLGIRLSPAAEISCVEAGEQDLHVVGYELEVADPSLLDALRDWRDDRERRILAMAARLEALGFALDDAVLRGRQAAGEPLGRPHLADAILAHPANADRLATEGITGRGELFAAYLVPGARGYVARTRPTVGDAITIIHAAGGVAIWAHPFWDVDDPRTATAALDRFTALGLDGVEAFYVAHTREQTLLLHDECVRRGLLATGSSDFHGPAHEHFDGFLAFELHGRGPILGPIGGV